MPRELFQTMKDEQLRKNFGNRLRELRRKQKWTQKEMAAKLGVCFSIFNKYECGLHIPPPEKLIEIAEICNTTLDYILTGNPTKEIPLQNVRLLERFRELEQFETSDQETVIKLVDAFIVQNKMTKAMNPFASKGTR